VAVDEDGNVTVVWYHLSGSPTQLQSAVRPAGQAWEPAVDITGPGSQGEVQLATSGSGKAVAVWMSYEGAEWVVRGARRPSVEGAWGAVELVSAPQVQTTGSAREPRLAANAAGALAATWYRTAMSGNWIEATSGSPTTGWAPPVTTSGTHAERPQLVMDASGNAALVWMSWNGMFYVIQTAFRPADGAWTPVRDLTSSRATSQPQVVITPNGRLVATWTRYDGVSAIVQAAEIDPLAPPTDSPSPSSTPSASTATAVPTTTPPTTAGPTSAPAIPPLLRHVRLTSSTIHVKGSDESPKVTKLKLTLNTDAGVTVKLKRTMKVDGKTVKASLTKALEKGAAAIKLTSKIGSKKLPPGTYQVTVTAKNGVGTSVATTLKLTIRK
jgi:hypothetical protein